MDTQLFRDIKDKLDHNYTIVGKERKYRNASVLIPLVKIREDIHILFQVRADHIRQGGEIGFPGGMIEDVDQGDYEKTAIRETIEELGLEERQIDVLGYLGAYVAHSDVTIDVYVGFLDMEDLSLLELSEEVAEIFTVPLKALQAMPEEVHYINMRIQQTFVDEEGDEISLIDAASLGLPERYHRPFYDRRRKVYFYRYEGYTIWGMTGEMLYEFLALL